MASKTPKQRIVIVLGSPRKRGNSATLAREVAAGAKAAGAKVDTFFLDGMTIRACRACEACRKGPAYACAVADDMRKIYPKLRAADALVIASPVYWFTVSAQTKLFMDRCYALGGSGKHALAGKRIGIVMTYADPDPFSSGAVNALRTFQDGFRYLGSEIVDMVYGSAWKAGEIRKNTPLLKEARKLGKKLATPPAAGGAL